MKITIEVESWDELTKVAQEVLTKQSEQLELPLDDLPPHPAQEKAAEPAQDAPETAAKPKPVPEATEKDDAAKKRSEAAKKAAATRKANQAKRKAEKKAKPKSNGKGVDTVEITPGDQPLPNSPEARKAERKAREKLTKEERTAIDRPEDAEEAEATAEAAPEIVANATYDDVKSAVDSAVIANGTGPVIGVLAEYEVKHAKDLHPTQWRSFIDDLGRLDG